ncbi:hypothetical protein VIGAN_01261000 [Vigna angularis var. angularis]|uniref:Uncharacterized protein n=1 Tax=Vigna angularis var. angularis TaxID=157739 RepID=A0A0S3R2J9_PHAAN|nr:hypothetical protein VIGAN_01261000 [Vigna angularis var. angularis]
MPSSSPKSDKFVLPHLRPGFVPVEEPHLGRVCSFDHCRLLVVGITNTIDNIVHFFLLGLCMNDWIITCFAGLEFLLAFSKFCYWSMECGCPSLYEVVHERLLAVLEGVRVGLLTILVEGREGDLAGKVAMVFSAGFFELGIGHGHRRKKGKVLPYLLTGELEQREKQLFRDKSKKKVTTLLPQFIRNRGEKSFKKKKKKPTASITCEPRQNPTPFCLGCEPRPKAYPFLPRLYMPRFRNRYLCVKITAVVFFHCTSV